MAETFQRPGWYPDPDGKPGERWWNGTSWSESRRGGTQPDVPVTPPPAYSGVNSAPVRPDPYAPPATISGNTARTGIDTRANRSAMIGFITGIISLFVGILPVLPPIAIVFSILGIVKARQLKAQGAPSTLMTFALIGLATGVISGITSLVSLIVFINALGVGSS